MSPLKQSLLSIPDPRRAQGKRFDLPHLLLFSILAVMSGATSYRRIHRFIRTHQARLNAAFGCGWRSAPAYSTVRYILQGLDVEALAPHFQAHAAGLAGDSAIIALDGKTLRGSLDRFEDRRAAQVLSAFAVGEQLVLGQIVLTDVDKTHEIQAAQQLIAALGLSDRLYTLDALHLQKNG